MRWLANEPENRSVDPVAAGSNSASLKGKAEGPTGRRLDRIVAIWSKVIERVRDLGRRVWLRRTLLALSLLLPVAVFAILAHQAWPALPTFADADPALLLLALVVLVIGYLGQTVSLHLLGSGTAPWRTLVALPWAVSAVNRVTPASSGGAILMVHVLRRHGCTMSESVARTAAIGVIHRLAGWIVLFCALGTHVPVPWFAKAVPLLVVAVVGVLLVPPVRRQLSRARSLPTLIPFTLLPAVLLAQLVTRLAPTLILWCCLHALGHPLPLITVLTVVVTAGLVGSTPIPGGGGAVEAALTAGLHTAGLSLPVAAAGAVLARLLSYWLPALPGAILLPFLRGGHARDEMGERSARKLGIADVHARLAQRGARSPLPPTLGLPPSSSSGVPARGGLALQPVHRQVVRSTP